MRLISPIFKRKSTAITFTVLPLVVAGSFLVHHFFFNTAQEASAWYSDNWLYRQGIPIQNSGAEREDYQVAITVDTSTPINAGKMQSMCQDIRFASKITGKDLPYWIESGCDSATTKIWVNVDKLPSSASSTYPTIDMYYGNPTAPKGENGDETFLFFDDFENDLSKWEPTLKGSTTSSVIAVQTDHTVRLAPNPNHDASANIVSNKTFTNGIAVESRRKQDANGNYLIFSLGSGEIQNDDGGSNDWYQTFLASGYAWNRHQETSHGANKITEIAPGSADVPLSTNFATTDSSVYARWQYIYESSGDLWWFINDNYVGSATDTTYLTNIKKLMFSQGEFNNGAGTLQNIDWVFVRKYDEQSTEPTMGTIQSEEQGKGAVGFWRFDEGYGSVAHDQAQNNDGTITNAVWKNEEECKNGKCLYFDGTGDYVSATGTPLNTLKSEVSVSAWVRPASLSSNMGIVDKDRSNTGFTLDWNTTDSVFRFGSDGSIGTYATSTRTIEVGNWYHIAGTYDGANLKIYIDGVLEDTEPNTTDFVDDQASVLIGSNDDSDDFDGYIDEVHLYNYARAAAEVKADYLAGLKGGTASIGKSKNQRLNDGLVAHYKMDEIAGWSGVANEVIDSSGAGNHGVRSGDATTTSTAKFGTSGDFDGTGDYVTLSDILDTTKTYSYSVWARADTAWTGDDAIGGVYSAGGNGTMLYVGSNSICAWNSTTNNVCVSTPSVDVWHHYAIVDDDKYIYFYIDGVLQGTGDSASGDGTSFYIGTYNARSASSFDGHIDNFRVYNRALSESEVLDLYEEAPPPVLHIKMDENTGTTAYDSAGSNDGTLTASPETPTWKGAGECVRGGCLEFDGVDDDIIITDNDTLDIKSAITMSAWIKPDLLDHSNGGTWPRILNKSSAYAMWLSTNGAFNVRFTGLSDTDIVSTGSAVPLDKWTYVTATYDQSTGNKIVYINGIENQREANTTGEISTNANNFYVGDAGTGARQWDGKIDDVRIYNYAMNTKQIAEAMQAGAPATSNRAEGNPVGGPILYYDFENLGMATTSDYTNVRSVVYDKSGRGNHGEVYNATSTPGKFGKALGFDGSGDYVDLPGFSSTAQTYTFSMWAKSSLADATYDYLFDTATGRLILSWFGATSGQIGINTGVWGYFGDAPNDGEWHHLVFLLDGSLSTAEMYLDGSKFGNTVSYTPRDIGGATAIGSKNDASASYFQGNLDEFKIYEYLLNEDEIKVDYNKGKALLVTPAQNPSVISNGSGKDPGGSAPILHLSFDEGFGYTTSTDKSGNGNDGGLAEGTASPTWKGSGYCAKGGCLEFDGTNDYALAGDSTTLDLTTAGSVSAWVRADSLTSNMGIVDKDRSVSGYHLGWHSANSVFRFGRDNGGIFASSTISISIGQWYHLVGTYDGANLKFYVNGILEDTEAFTADFTNTANQLLIGNTDDSLFFDGMIDEAKIWNRALTPAEIAYEYNGGKPVGHWKFDEGDGDWAYDASGNNNHGYVIIGESGTNTATSTAWQNGATGKFNGSLDFDGTDDRVIVTKDYTNESVSVAAWFYQDAIDSTDTIFEKYESASNRWGVRVTGGVLSIYDDIDNAGENLYSTNVNAEEWYHVVATINSDLTQDFYLNGDLIGSGDTALDGFDSITGNLNIGQRGGETLSFDGLIDDVRIYNYALNAAQVNQVYNNGKALYFK